MAKFFIILALIMALMLPIKTTIHAVFDALWAEGIFTIWLGVCLFFIVAVFNYKSVQLKRKIRAGLGLVNPSSVCVCVCVCVCVYVCVYE